MYPWIVFLHVLSGLALMLQHGVEASVMFGLRNQSDPEKLWLTFLILPEHNTARLRVLLGAVIVTGLIAGFMLPWWQNLWMWTALGILVVITVVMLLAGGPYFTLVENAADAVLTARAEGMPDAELVEAYNAARALPHPIIAAAVGLGGLAAILWLMMFKPF